jgi:hypothetical protein
MIYKASNYLYQRIFINIFIFCILIICFSLISTNTNNIIFKEWNKYDHINNKTLINSSDKYEMTINYPLTYNRKVNNEIKSLINTYIKKLKYDTKFFTPADENDKFNMKIKYNVERVNQEIVSFIFHINYYYNYSMNSIDIISRTFNLRSGKELILMDFFDERLGYINVLCNKSKESLINYIGINKKNLNYFIDDISFSLQNSFDAYAFSNTHLIIYFNSNKLSSDFKDIYEIKIPWIEVEHLLKDNIIINK